LPDVPDDFNAWSRASDQGSGPRSEERRGGLKIGERNRTETVYAFLKRLQAIELSRRIRMEDRKRLQESILQRAIGGKIPCAVCLRMADDFDMPKKDLTKILNEMKIKISQCQLGCFE
jgi:hypothetical protein